MEELTIVLSLNETETLATKAARGAGLGWGEAEDLGRGARWLAARGLDWSGPLLQLLNSPTERAGLASLIGVADRASGLDAGFRAVIGSCRPAWALAIPATLARGGVSLTLRSPDFRFRLSPGGFASTDGNALDIAGAPATEILVEPSADPDPLPHWLKPTTRRSAVPAARMRELEAYAARTYVPASVESRRLGAGGSRIDDS